MNCFNGEAHLCEAVESVIAQSFEDWELVFFDNLSTDKSAELFNSYDDARLKYVQASVHTDLGGARAAAYPFLTGDYIAVLDADDVWLPNKLEQQLPLFDDEAVGIVISDTIFFTHDREKRLFDGSSPPEGWVTNELLKKYFVSLETLMFRRSVADKLAVTFDAEFSYIADFDIVLRMSQISKLAYCPKVLAKWRVHEGSDTWRNLGAFAEEKERWITKQTRASDHLVIRYPDTFDQFCRTVYCHRALFLMISGERRQALVKLSHTGLKTLRDWVVLALVLLPLSDYLASWI